MSVSSKDRKIIYKETLDNVRSGTKTDKCPLSNPDIGVISENDHRNKMCLCPICTCGKHICPSSSIQDPYPTSIYSSQYMQNFQNKVQSKVPVIKYRGNFIPTSQIYFETTNEDCYKPHLIPEDSTTHKYTPLSPPKSAFSAKTSYANTFLNWGPGNLIPSMSPPKPVPESTKFSSKSSYKDNFSPASPEVIKAALDGIVKVKKKVHIDPNAAFFKHTTNRKDFVDFSTKAMKPTPFRHDRVVPRMKSVDNHYITTTQNDYKNFESAYDHRALRKIIEKEKLII
jgi:hypothetical protein